MSRTRQKYNSKILYLYSMTTTDTTNHIKNTFSTIGQPFQADEFGERLVEEKDVLSGRVLQSTTLTKYKTTSQLNFKIGDKVSELPNADQTSMSAIVRTYRKPLNKRGLKHNRDAIYEWTLEIS